MGGAGGGEDLTRGADRRAVVLVDGEHHPPVLRVALSGLSPRTTHVLVVGGGEKLDVPGEAPDLGLPARWAQHPERELAEILSEGRFEVVLDLSGDPVVDAQRRLRLAAVALSRGVPYAAPGLRYTPPDLPVLTSRTTVSVVATGKRSGKTAVSGALVRHMVGRGRTPVVVAMGRGGPTDPEVVSAGTLLDAGQLLRVADRGGHAASDFYEDAVTTGAATVGSYRVGDGPAGWVAASNVPAGVSAAESEPGDLTLLEGSGAALPPCHADATAMLIPATLRIDQLRSVLPLSFILADLFIVTFADGVSAGRLGELARSVRELLGVLPGRDGPARDCPQVLLTRFRPHPLGDVRGRRVFFATTAGQGTLPTMVRELEEGWGAQVVASSYNLADRPALLRDIARAPAYEVMLTELKAAAIDVAARAGLKAGADVVFCDHRLELIGAEDLPSTQLPDAFDGLLAAADRRHAARSAD
ncbi:MAG TPA: hypothetical protein VHF25_13950 [Nitriliruptorales bacterium]|nr:hypothetical protein [Nitriliruptorales bacterium]